MKAVGVVLKQLMTTRSRFRERERDESFDEKLEKLRLNLNNIKYVFVRVKKNEKQLLDTLAEVYEHLRKFERRKLDEEMNGICKRIRDSAEKLVPMDGFDESSKEEDHKPAQIFHSSQELQQLYQKSWTMKDFDRLDDTTRCCLMPLLMFPENAVIRKRNAINLWIGEEIVRDEPDTEAEELCDGVIHDLLESRAIVRYGNEKSPIVNKFRILPAVHRLLEPYISNLKARLLKGSLYFRTKEDRLVLKQKKLQ